MLPFRTHPQMSTTGTGGYLLSGIKVVAQSPAAPAALQSQLGGKVAEAPADSVAKAPADSAEQHLAVPAAVEAAQAEGPSAKKLKMQDSSTDAVAVLEPN